MCYFLRTILSICLIVCALSPGFSRAAESRTALIIGNKDYKSISSLKNPLNDANDMAAVLEKLGFDVILKNNIDLAQLRDGVRAFGDRIKDGGVGLFYYAGHGVQLDGVNYIIPVEVDIKRKYDVEDQCLRMNYVLSAMEEANNKLNIIILDACRNNPFRDFRDISAGFVSMKAPQGSIIAYSTAPDKKAGDGTGRNGTYTSSLLKYIVKPNLSLYEVFNRTGLEVKEKTNNTQVPWISSSPVPPFYLKGGLPKVTKSPLSDIPFFPRPLPQSVEIWTEPTKQSHTTAAVTYIYEAATGNITELGNRYRDKIEQVFRQKGYEVKARRDLPVLLEDLELFGTKNDKMQLWEQASAEVLVCGSYTVIKSREPGVNDKIEVHVKAFRTADTTLVEAYTIEEELNYGWLSLAAKIHSNIHKRNFETASGTLAQSDKSRDVPKLRVSLDRDPALYLPGESAEILIESEKGAHVYIFNIAADNTVSLLYPNELMPELPLASETFVFPPKNFSGQVSLVLSPLIAGEPCREAFKVIASGNKMDFSFLPIPVNRIYKGAKAGEIRQLNKKLDEYKDFSALTVHYWVGRKPGSGYGKQEFSNQ
jgi:hypothetical protein